MSQFLTATSSHERYDSSRSIYMLSCLLFAASFFSQASSTLPQPSVSFSFLQPISPIPFTKTQHYLYDQISPRMHFFDYSMTDRTCLLTTTNASPWQCCRCGVRNSQAGPYHQCSNCPHQHCGYCSNVGVWYPWNMASPTKHEEC